MAFFPFMVQLEDKTCLIVGGGRTASRKARQMLCFGARVKLVGRDVADEILHIEGDRLTVIEREAALSDIDGCDVVIMATDDSELNSLFARHCREKKIPVNVVDVKEDCDFYFPAIIKQGEVVISVSTGGMSPLLASRIKKDISGGLRDDYGRIADEMGRLRESVIEGETNEADRKEKFMEILDEKLNRKLIRVGTRASRLALVQTNMVIDALKCQYPEYTFEKTIFKTKGDKNRDVPVSEFGGKAVFVEDIESALISGDIDMAVHSAKDMPCPLTEGLAVAGVLKRGGVRDVLIYKRGLDKDRPFVVGTGSLRRQCQLKELYPNAVCSNLRGNVGTRLDRLKEGSYDAVILAEAGIERLGLDSEDGLCYEYLDVKDMLPAAGQAVIAVETRNTGNAFLMAESIGDRDTGLALDAERRVLKVLDAGCHEPIGVYASVNGGSIDLRLMNGRKGVIRKRSVSGALDMIDRLIEELCKED